MGKDWLKKDTFVKQKQFKQMLGKNPTIKDIGRTLIITNILLYVVWVVLSNLTSVFVLNQCVISKILTI